MSGLQIPSVTLEDLEAFQAKHFPGSAQTPAIQGPYDETVDHQLEEYEDEDDLGYYPDGVKRTLTDEQIRIFRHSEIHSLLREKQLREEALLEAAEEERREEAAETQKPAASDADTAVPTNKHERTDGQEASDSLLDYGEDAPVGKAQKRARPGYAPPFVGRKIISYDD
ncbi:hypothetical protein P170DRAFT_425010 [Aspergillus steynii IBT 23096]|uniref:Uncharacterized protein n=1 Tax=Aspergillus steynii IBT 23096 TaxID=1392250 RepID=A0A2I2GCV3_9EURO|nr:uncharacterized protein P170DRAFT_425010 [Aspergillus steynii IBT 23096]PLB50695.1 hypothetical protein P170DRAFT_425010 [Aspergillus steynii IBT 23096]